MIYMTENVSTEAAAEEVRHGQWHADPAVPSEHSEEDR